MSEIYMVTGAQLFVFMFQEPRFAYQMHIVCVILALFAKTQITAKTIIRPYPIANSVVEDVQY